MRNVIIGGTEKSGTTSIFSYLSSHPEVSASGVKETDYFRRAISDIGSAREQYLEHFPDKNGERIFLEASPGYLGLSETVYPQIKKVLSDVKHIFLLRHPVDRFVSSYKFHKSKYNLPENLAFSEYVNLCLDYHAGKISIEESGIGKWFLDVLPAGLYSKNLSNVFDSFSRDDVKVYFFDELNESPKSVLMSISNFIGIDSGFYSDFTFEKKNVTFFAKNKFFHKFAMNINSYFEPFFLKFPNLKSTLLSLYKRLNADSRKSSDEIDESSLLLLNKFYADDVNNLSCLYGFSVPESWRSLSEK